MATSYFFLVLGFVLFILAGLSIPAGRANLGWLGAAAITAALWFTHGQVG